jgi:hypothetical protein
VSSSAVSKQDLNLTLDRGVGKAKCAAEVAMTGGPSILAQADEVLE